MEKYLKKMRKCPFCGSDHRDHWTWFGKANGLEMLNHFCHTSENSGLETTIAVYGATKEECVERWNHRGKVKTSKGL